MVTSNAGASVTCESKDTIAQESEPETMVHSPNDIDIIELLGLNRFHEQFEPRRFEIINVIAII